MPHTQRISRLAKRLAADNSFCDPSMQLFYVENCRHRRTGLISRRKESIRNEKKRRNENALERIVSPLSPLEICIRYVRHVV